MVVKAWGVASLEALGMEDSVAVLAEGSIVTVYVIVEALRMAASVALEALTTATEM